MTRAPIPAPFEGPFDDDDEDVDMGDTCWDKKPAARPDPPAAGEHSGEQSPPSAEDNNNNIAQTPSSHDNNDNNTARSELMQHLHAVSSIAANNFPGVSQYLALAMQQMTSPPHRQQRHTSKPDPPEVRTGWPTVQTEATPTDAAASMNTTTTAKQDIIDLTVDDDNNDEQEDTVADTRNESTTTTTTTKNNDDEDNIGMDNTTEARNNETTEEDNNDERMATMAVAPALHSTNIESTTTMNKRRSPRKSRYPHSYTVGPRVTFAPDLETNNDPNEESPPPTHGKRRRGHHRSRGHRSRRSSSSRSRRSSRSSKRKERTHHRHSDSSSSNESDSNYSNQSEYSNNSNPGSNSVATDDANASTLGLDMDLDVEMELDYDRCPPFYTYTKAATKEEGTQTLEEPPEKEKETTTEELRTTTRNESAHETTAHETTVHETTVHESATPMQQPTTTEAAHQTTGPKGRHPNQHPNQHQSTVPELLELIQDLRLGVRESPGMTLPPHEVTNKKICMASNISRHYKLQNPIYIKNNNGIKSKISDNHTIEGWGLNEDRRIAAVMRQGGVCFYCKTIP